jgi:hypothetical protein
MDMFAFRGTKLENTCRGLKKATIFDVIRA